MRRLFAFCLPQVILLDYLDGFDPIHIRPSLWKTAWQEMLQVRPVENKESGGALEGLKLYLRAPESRRLFGIEQFTPQPGVMLPKGGRIWLY
jgi:hypothetical protein